MTSSDFAMSLVRPLLFKLLGLVLSIIPLLGIIPKLFKHGLKVFKVRERPLPPKVLNDPKWGDHKYINLPGLKMHYVEKGDHSKPLMVFLHGYPEFWFSWRYQLEHFSRDYWCVAPDNRGYNDTEKPSGVDKYSKEHLATDIKNLVKGLGRERCILVGHDWGGAIGYQVCQMYPEIVYNYIVLNLPHPKGLYAEMASGWGQRLKSWYIGFFQCPWLPEMYMRLGDMAIFNAMFADMKKPVDNESIEAYKFAFRDSMAFKNPINYYRAMIQYPGPEPPSGQKLKVPVFSIFGTADKYLSVAANRRSRDYIQDYEEEYFEGVSHWIMTEEPRLVNAAMEKYLESKRGANRL